MSWDEYFFLFGTVYLHWGVVLNSPGVKCDNVIKGLFWCESCNPESTRGSLSSLRSPVDRGAAVIQAVEVADGAQLVTPFNSSGVHDMMVKGQRAALAGALWRGDFEESMAVLRAANADLLFVLRAQIQNTGQLGERGLAAVHTELCWNSR